MLPRLLPVIDALYAVRASGAKIKIKQLKSYAFYSVELFKMKTCDKHRRAPKAAAAARFFDDDARNLYGAYLRNIKRKYAPHVPEAYLMVAREISGVRAKKIPQMRHFDAHARGER